MNVVERYKKHLKSRSESLAFRYQQVKKSKHKTFSWRRYLRDNGKSNELFETMVARLTLEELIALKLDLTSSSMGKGMFGLQIWSAVHEIVRAAVLIYASSVTINRTEAASMLGIDQGVFLGVKLSTQSAGDIYSDEELRKFQVNKEIW